MLPYYVKLSLNARINKWFSIHENIKYKTFLSDTCKRDIFLLV